MGPPNVLGLPNPASSISTTRTFGAPAGGATWPINAQSGSEPASVFSVTPVNRGRRMGSRLRSIMSSLTWRFLSWCPSKSGSCLRRDRAHGGPVAGQAIRQLGRERPRVLGVVRLEVRRGDLHPEVALAVLAL